MIEKGIKVLHKSLGVGVVRFSEEDEVCVRFESGKIALVAPDSLVEWLPDPSNDFKCEYPRNFLPMIQAKCILSANARWGVFAQSKITLLPHQLWVCQRARRMDPCRLLVADDVGLGKTIEAGLILSSFQNAGRAGRILILTPASLVVQWQNRMREMFNLRMDTYHTIVDSPTARYWESHDQIVASIDTLKLDDRGAEDRRERLLNASPWDIVVVDEAHHLGNDPNMGATLGYRLIRDLEEHGKIRALLFFTGTPHTGKNYKFLSLMQLLDAKKFSTREPLEGQLSQLSDYMIRNNKYTVTDMKGHRLFQMPETHPETYSYNEEETEFYNTMTMFIQDGLAYAATIQDGSESRAVQLVLVALQKLASSSVAAILHALRKRRGTVTATETQLRKIMSDIEQARNGGDLETLAKAEETLPILSAKIKLLENEGPALDNLIQLAEAVKDETKIQTILDTIRTNHSHDSVLLFTEYKATQRAVLAALMREYGPDCATFINGDERLDDVPFPDGSLRSWTRLRADAANAFNMGRRRFLVATEAAGEGIDLQDNCHVLFHVDLPWNPMRLQQRVGRLNRYGQTKKVIVRLFQNPDTVESRIWECLNEKLAKITKTLGAVMEERENLFDLVLGATPPGLFDDIFTMQRTGMDTPEGLSHYWDERTGRLGGMDPVAAVREIGENVAKFDFQNVSAILPDIGLDALLPFLRNALRTADKSLQEEPDGTVSFDFPSSWKDKPVEKGLQPSYNRLLLHRGGKINATIGVGFKPLDRALERMNTQHGVNCVFRDLDISWFVYSVRNRYTDAALANERHLYACSVDWQGNVMEVIPDWKFLKILNGLNAAQRPIHSTSIEDLKSWSETASKESADAILNYLRDHPQEETHADPELTLEGVLLAVPPQ